MVYGIDGIIVEVEVDIHNGLPGWGSTTVANSRFMAYTLE